jgi:D-cysteine desulfhydrase
VCQQFGLQPVCSYYCQPVTDEVRDHLAVSVPLGIDAHFCGDYVGLAASFLWQYLVWFLRTGCPPYFIYPGAPGTLGTLGYVNAAFEIKAQLERRALPAPEAIFVAVGSCGTFAGLLLGARLAGLTSLVLGVRVIEEDVANRLKIARMVSRTARYLHRREPILPALRMGPDEVALMDGYVGPGYAHPSPEAQRAVGWVAQAEGLQLETTYTGKAMAALLDYAESHPGSRLLFIDTFTESRGLEKGDWRALPAQFWPVFDPAHEAHCRCLRSWRDPQFCWKKQLGSDYRSERRRER